MFLREITCWARASILGATFPGVASTRGLYPQGPDHYPASLALDPEAHAVREEIGQAEGGEGPSRVPHESPPLAPDGANEEKFPPLQHRDRKPVGEDADIGEGHLRLGHPHSRERGRLAEAGQLVRGEAPRFRAENERGDLAFAQRGHPRHRLPDVEYKIPSVGPAGKGYREGGVDEGATEIGEDADLLQHILGAPGRA